MAARIKIQDVTELLHKDHQTVRELFFNFSRAENDTEKGQLVKQILSELYFHAKVEEEIVYPILDEEGDDAEDLKAEAENEHRVVKFLMAEISNMEIDDDDLKAKMTVLCELIEHHVKEEEKEMFKMLRDSDSDLQALAEEVEARKAELKKEGLPIMKATLQIGDEGDDDNDDDDDDEAEEDEVKGAKKAKKPSTNALKSKKTAAPLPTGKPRRKTA